MKKHLLPFLFILLCTACKKSGGDTTGEQIKEEEEEENGLTGGKSFVTTLTGAAEVPGPGDNNGSGTLEMSLNLGKKMIVYKLNTASIAAPTAAQLHEGAVDKEGPVRITLKAPVNGTITDTIYELDRTMLQKIMKNPENYYVNVLNGPYPKGAIRGQIAK
jgi:hypothetical protein